MRINQVCIELNITKKAIRYYEKQGLLEIPKHNNGYRNFTTSHIDILREITLYRKLDISTSNIYLLLNSKSKQEELEKIKKEKNKVIREVIKQESYLDRMITSELNNDNIKKLLDEIVESEVEDSSFIIKKLNECFPGGIGVIISAHFDCFKFDEIKTKEQNLAWMNIIKFLDDAYIEVSDEMMSILSDVDFTRTRNIHNNMKDDLLNNKLDSKKIETLKKASEGIYEELPDETYDQMMVYQDNLKKFFSSSAYKENVIENIKILSKEYREYHDSFTRINV